MPKPKTTIVTLDYVSRKEYSIVYVSEVWDQLHDLLRDPADFFHDVSNKYSYDTSRVGRWAPREPFTLILEPLEAKVDKARQALLAKQEAATHAPVVNQLIELWRGGKLQEYLQSEFKNGVFMAEFTIETGLILVRYLPPPKLPSQRYFGQILPPTIALESGTLCGSIHFDIGDSDLTRADFVMDYIEDRKRAIGLICSHSGFKRVDGTYKEVPPPIETIPTSLPVPIPPGPPQADVKPDTRLGNPYVAVEYQIQGSLGGCVCAIANVYQEGGTYFVGGGEVKWYTTCPRGITEEEVGPQETAAS